MYDIAVHSHVLKRQKITFFKVLFLGWKHCNLEDTVMKV